MAIVRFVRVLWSRTRFWIIRWVPVLVFTWLVINWNFDDPNLFNPNGTGTVDLGFPLSWRIQTFGVGVPLRQWNWWYASADYLIWAIPTVQWYLVAKKKWGRPPKHASV